MDNENQKVHAANGEEQENLFPPLPPRPLSPEIVFLGILPAVAQVAPAMDPPADHNMDVHVAPIMMPEVADAPIAIPPVAQANHVAHADHVAYAAPLANPVIGPHVGPQINRIAVEAVMATLHERVSFAPLTKASPQDDGTTRMTPTPEGGFDRIHGDRPGWQLFGVKPSQSKLWKNLPKGKVIALINNMSSHETEPDRQEVMTFVPDILEKALDIKNVQLAVPDTPDNPHIRPIAFLIWNIDEAIAQAMIEQYAFGFPEFQFTCHPIHEEFPEFICTLKGFGPTFTNNKNDVLSLVLTTMREPDNWGKLARLAMKIPNLVTLAPGQAVNALLMRVRIEVVKEKGAGGTAKPIVNIFAPSPTTSIDTWQKYRDIFYYAKYSNGISGTGEGDNLFRQCATCHSFGHFKGLCPYIDVPYWPQSKEKTQQNNSSTHQQGSNQRGNRNNRRGNGGWRGGRGRGQRGY